MRTAVGKYRGKSGLWVQRDKWVAYDASPAVEAPRTTAVATMLRSSPTVPLGKNGAKSYHRNSHPGKANLE